MKIPEISSKEWCISTDIFETSRVPYEETMFTLANGYYGTRGSLEFAPYHGRPASYFAGLYDHTPCHHEELVNVPGWVDLQVRVCGLALDPGTVAVKQYRRVLDLKQGLLFTLVRWTDASNRSTRYQSCRLVHCATKQWAMLWGEVVPENWSGELILAGGINADVENITIQQHVRVRHSRIRSLEIDDRGVVFEGETVSAGLPMALRSSLVVSGAAQHTEADRNTLRQAYRIQAQRGKSVSFVKYVSLVGGPQAAGKPDIVARRCLGRLARSGTERAMASHVRAWAKRWKIADVIIDGKRDDQAAVRFNIFHLMQSGPGTDMDISIGAKALHGHGYRGHVFWDTEIFMLPFFTATTPEVARSLLMYRYRRLQAARKHAADFGYRGARFPWESAMDGSDVTPSAAVDIVAGRIREQPDPHFQHHITADVAYAVNHYRQATGDEAFFFDYGAQIIIETAQFWASRVTYDRRRKKYVIKHVQCADEYHMGVDNNAYTNYMAAENLRLGLKAVAELKARRPAQFRRLCREIGLKQGDTKQWRAILEKLYLPFNTKNKMIEQFDGYFDCLNVRVKFDRQGWPYIPKKYQSKLQGTQIIKQADVVLVFFLLPDLFPPDVVLKNFRYYEARDAQASSLSPNTYAIVGIEVGEYQRAYRSFRVSAFRDLLFRNNEDGIHAACLGGTWQAVVNGFGGLRIKHGIPTLKPWLPPEWKQLAFKFQWRGCLVSFRITHKKFEAKLERGRELKVQILDREYNLTRRLISGVLATD
ncbi:glycoside hydrolase family 65 protein [Candidatus Riflebacteria bacterium]